MKPREYSGREDLRAMQELVQRIWAPDSSRFHIGDVAWERNAMPGRESGWRTALWEENGQVVAWGWAELPGHLSLVVDPEYAQLAAEVISWFRNQAEGSLTCSVLETEGHLIKALEAAGFKVDDSLPYFTHHRMELTDLAAPEVPDGFTLRHVHEDEVEQRAGVHRASWSDWGPSKMTNESLAAVMSAWPYRPELDWVAVAPTGEFVASALIWLDDQNHVGLIEPVGCAPEYRRRGLAQAVDLAALHALKAAGGVRAVVCPRGDDGYPKARKLYQSIGFVPGPSTRTYRF